MKYNTKREYHVYEWFNKETGEVFYVGMGTGSRWKSKSKGKRNSRFNEYISTHCCESRKLYDHLTEKEACEIEDKLIKERKKEGLCWCNMTNCTSRHGKCVGISNSQYGVSPKERMSEEVYAGWLKKHKENKSRGDNGRATKIIVSKDNEIKEFDCVLDCAEYIRSQNLDITCSLDSTRSRISECMRCGKLFRGYMITTKYPEEYKATPKVKFQLYLNRELSDIATKYCKEKNMFLSVLITSLVGSQLNGDEIFKNTSGVIKTMRMDKDIEEKLQEQAKQFGVSRVVILNSLLRKFLKEKNLI